jgi:hypothetical protein
MPFLRLTTPPRYSCIFGLRKSLPMINVLFPATDSSNAKFIEKNVFPSPLTADVTPTTLWSFSKEKYFRFNRIALNESAKEDFLLVYKSKTFLLVEWVTTPNIGISVNDLRSFFTHDLVIERVFGDDDSHRDQ